MTNKTQRYTLREVRWTVNRKPGEPDAPRVTDPRAALSLIRKFATEDDDRERFWVIFLNGQNVYTGHHLISLGSLDVSIATPRDVFGAALREGAAAIVLAHNHPSGNPEPSAADVELTTAINSLGIMLGVPVIDHIIFCPDPDAWVSLASAGLLDGGVQWENLRKIFRTKKHEHAPKLSVTTTQ